MPGPTHPLLRPPPTVEEVRGRAVVLSARGLGRLVMVAVCAAVLWAMLLGWPLRWPGQQIAVYYGGQTWKQTLRQAMDAWNAADAGRSFVLVSDPVAADVVVAETTDLGAVCDSPRAVACVTAIGWNPGVQTRLYVPADRDDMGGTAPNKVFAHELGHVLGLTHTDGACQVMRSGAEDFSGCTAQRLGVPVKQRALPSCLPGEDAKRREWRCPRQPLHRAVCGPLAGDLARIRGLYGGAPRPRASVCLAADRWTIDSPMMQLMRRNALLRRVTPTLADTAPPRRRELCQLYLAAGAAPGRSGRLPHRFAEVCGEAMRAWPGGPH